MLLIPGGRDEKNGFIESAIAISWDFSDPFEHCG
jgi:hypothetical protein